MCLSVCLIVWCWWGPDSLIHEYSGSVKGGNELVMHSDVSVFLSAAGWFGDGPFQTWTHSNSLRRVGRGDVFRYMCPSVCLSVCRSVCLSVCTPVGLCGVSPGSIPDKHTVTQWSGQCMGWERGDLQMCVRVCVPAGVCVCLCVCLPACLPVCLFGCL